MDLVIVLFTITISLIAYVYTNKMFNKYKKKLSNSELSGFEVARKILDKYDLNEVYITEISGKYSDIYNGNRKVVKLCKEVFHGNSITSVGIAAFESVHAVEDSEKKPFYKYRETYYSFAKLLSYIGYFLIVIGIFFDLRRFHCLLIGVGFMMCCLIMNLITLKVEIGNARRSLDELLDQSIINKDENDAIKDVLSACAYKNVAFVINNVIEFCRLIYDFGKGK